MADTLQVNLVNGDSAVYAAEAKSYKEEAATSATAAATSATNAAKFDYTGIFKDSASAHNAIFRGKDLTSAYEAGSLSEAISAGTFADIYPGDYITKSITWNGAEKSIKWLVADCDYFLNTGDGLSTHHIVLTPDYLIDTAVWNDESTTEGGFLGSKLFGTTLPLVDTAITAAFGSDHVLEHQEFLTSVVTKTVPSGGNAAWTGAATDWQKTAVKSNIFNEVQVFGTTVFSSSGYDVGTGRRQMAVFKNERSIRRNYWLRAVASASFACVAASDGNAYFTGASYAVGLRPYFLFH